MKKRWQDLTIEQQIKVVKLKKEIQTVLPFKYRDLMLSRFPKYKEDKNIISNFVHYKYFSWDIYHDFETLINEYKSKNK